MIQMMPALPVSSVPQRILNNQEGAGQELFQTIGCFRPTFIEGHQASMMICTFWSPEI
jgi:hypothetical protein